MKGHDNKTTPGQGIWVTNTTMARLLALFLVYSFMVFMIGYFWGKRIVAAAIMQEVEEAYAEDSELVQNYQAPNQEQRAPQPLVPQAEPIALTELSGDTPKANRDVPEPTAHLYYALVATYGQEQTAQQFISRQKKRGIAVELRRRASRSAKGRKVTWYQVITKNFTNREELDKLVERIRHEEHLVGEVPILTC